MAAFASQPKTPKSSEARMGRPLSSLETPIASIAAVALGAEIIERHFTDTPEITIGDHCFSATPDSFSEMVRTIRNLEKAISLDDIEPNAKEVEMRDLMRRSLAVKNAVKQGGPLELSNIIAIRPERGISPVRVHELVGKLATRDIPPLTLLSFKDFD
mgnify:CR=1 FL=1